MPITNRFKIVEELKKGPSYLSSLYVLAGEEPFFIDAVCQLFETKVIKPEEEDFCKTILYGAQTTALEVAGYAMQFPMMGERNLVVLKEAQALPDIKQLYPYLEQLPQSTILVICFKKELTAKGTNSKLFQVANDKGALMLSERIKEYDLPRFITENTKRRSCVIREREADYLAMMIGNDLQKLYNEVEKLCIKAIKLPDRTISEELIRELVADSKVYKTFDLLDAIIERNIEKSFAIGLRFARTEKDYPIQSILPLLFNFFSNLIVLHYIPKAEQTDDFIKIALKISPFQVRKYKQATAKYNPRKTFDIIRLIRMIDAKSKGLEGVAIPVPDLYKELIAGIVY